MSIIKIKGDKSRYKVLDKDCIGRSCLMLGYYQTRGATGTGSRYTGQIDACCLTRAYHSCPYIDGKLYEIDQSLIAARKKIQGMKVS